MTITARYASTCPTCSQRITPGQSVEWAKGSPARHTSCGAPLRAQPTRSRAGGIVSRQRPSWARSGGAWTGCSMGCREGSPNPRCQSCCFDEYDN